jgi:hypothetical protein
MTCVANSGSERRCKWVEEIREEYAKLWSQGIGRRWIGGGEFGPTSGAVPAAGKKRGERVVDGVVRIMVR